MAARVAIPFARRERLASAACFFLLISFSEKINQLSHFKTIIDTQAAKGNRFFFLRRKGTENVTGLTGNGPAGAQKNRFGFLLRLPRGKFKHNRALKNWKAVL